VEDVLWAALVRAWRRLRPAPGTGGAR
jgi:hypothetical protein